jgi:hypothetical protein
MQSEIEKEEYMIYWYMPLYIYFRAGQVEADMKGDVM